MPERARAVVLASTGTGDIIPNATVTVREPGTSTSISETIYSADDPDLSQYTNGAFFTSATGIVTFYLTNQKRVDVLFTKSGYTSVTIPVDVQKSSLVSGYATVMDEAATLTQRGTLRFTGDGVTAADDAANGRTNVTIAASDIATATLWDAAGDLAKGTGADTAARLARGSALQILRTNAGGTDIEWGAVPTHTAALHTFVGARVYRSAALSLNNTTDTIIGFDAEDSDPQGFHDNATNNSRLTIPAGYAGTYTIYGVVLFTANATGHRRGSIKRNGIGMTQTHQSVVGSGGSQSLFWYTTASASVGDYFELEAWQDSGAGLALSVGSNATWFGCHLLGV